LLIQKCIIFLNNIVFKDEEEEEEEGENNEVRGERVVDMNCFRSISTGAQYVTLALKTLDEVQ
jgi:hypothetical protein